MRHDLDYNAKHKKFEVTNIKVGSSFVLTNKTVLEKHLLHEIRKDAENNKTFKVTTLS
jgi:hypothetical protein